MKLHFRLPQLGSCHCLSECPVADPLYSPNTTWRHSIVETIRASSASNKTQYRGFFRSDNLMRCHREPDVLLFSSSLDWEPVTVLKTAQFHFSHKMLLLPPSCMSANSKECSILAEAFIYQVLQEERRIDNDIFPSTILPTKVQSLLSTGKGAKIPVHVDFQLPDSMTVVERSKKLT
jgi:hypothetical protein